MFTGIMTTIFIYLIIGIIVGIMSDDTGEIKRMTKEILKGAFTWPLDLYNYFKEK